MHKPLKIAFRFIWKKNRNRNALRRESGIRIKWPSWLNRVLLEEKARLASNRWIGPDFEKEIYKRGWVDGYMTALNDLPQTEEHGNATH